METNLLQRLLHFFKHRWSRWVTYVEEYEHVHNVVRQQRRCLICNRVEDKMLPGSKIVTEELNG